MNSSTSQVVGVDDVAGFKFSRTSTGKTGDEDERDSHRSSNRDPDLGCANLRFVLVLAQMKPKTFLDFDVEKTKLTLHR